MSACRWTDPGSPWMAEVDIDIVGCDTRRANPQATSPLTPETIDEVRDAYASRRECGESVLGIALRYKLSLSTVSRIGRGWLPRMRQQP